MRIFVPGWNLVPTESSHSAAPVRHHRLGHHTGQELGLFRSLNQPVPVAVVQLPQAGDQLGIRIRHVGRAYSISSVMPTSRMANPSSLSASLKGR